MKNEKEYRNYINFENGGTEQEQKLWLESFLFLMKKVTLRYTNTWDGAAKSKPLLIKSPVHTGRVKLLYQLCRSSDKNIISIMSVITSIISVIG